FMGLVYTWANGKLLARMQNRVGPRWFQPVADTVKLMAKEDVVANGASGGWFMLLPVLGLAGVLTAGLYVPLLGLPAAYSFEGDLIVVVYLLGLLSFSLGLAGMMLKNSFAQIGSARAFTQLFAYEVPFMMAMLGPAFVAGTWQISEINSYFGGQWVLFLQPIGFAVAIISLMAKLEMPPFDAPVAKTEIVAGAMTEYTGRGLALFKLAHGAELVIGLTLVATLYLGGIGNPISFLLKTAGLLVVLVSIEALVTRLRIDQSVQFWWRWGIILVLAQWAIIILVEGML
ncbi:MAG: complex I subunit 1 family protein, partial [Anaerolineales bacterium]